MCQRIIIVSTTCGSWSRGHYGCGASAARARGPSKRNHRRIYYIRIEPREFHWFTASFPCLARELAAFFVIYRDRTHAAHMILYNQVCCSSYAFCDEARDSGMVVMGCCSLSVTLKCRQSLAHLRRGAAVWRKICLHLSWRLLGYLEVARFL